MGTTGGDLEGNQETEVDEINKLNYTAIFCRAQTVEPNLIRQFDYSMICGFMFPVLHLYH